jgi:hypothetical protein
MMAVEGQTADVSCTVQESVVDSNGMHVLTVRSAFQAKPVQVSVLLPRRSDPARRYPVLYVLPVNPGSEGPWGCGIAEARKLDLPDRYGLICVEPAFAGVPWFGDHPTDPAVRNDAYLPDVVVPLVDRTYPTVAAPERRLLVGFSKSGMGAFSLLLRHPDVFGRAASWDGCLMLAEPGPYGSGPVYADAANFARYCVPRLLEKQAGLLMGRPARLACLGYGGFQADQEACHALMNRLRVPHFYRNETQREHRWDSGWLPEAVEVLVAPDMAAP